jgi:hypothetical protein
LLHTPLAAYCCMPCKIIEVASIRSIMPR